MPCLNTTSYRPGDWFPTQSSVILEVWGITAQFRNWIEWHVWEFLFTSFILVPACRNETANGGWWPAVMDIRSHQFTVAALQLCGSGETTWQYGLIWSLLLCDRHPVNHFATYLVYCFLSINIFILYVYILYLSDFPDLSVIASKM